MNTPLPKKQDKLIMTQLGILLGISFPIGGIVIELFWKSLPLTLSSIGSLYTQGPIHWIVLTSPVVLGVVFNYFERKVQAREQKLQREQQKNADQLINIESFVNNVEAGDFTEKTYTFENPKLGEMLNSMKSKLARQKREDERAKWTAEGLAVIGQLLHTSTSVDHLSDEILRYLVKYVDLNQGSLFIMDSGEAQESVLDMKACYAYDRKKHHRQSISPGNGLIGQCFLENDTIILKDVPAGFVKITSGLGEATPRFVLLTPVKTADYTEGVLEVAAFRVLETFEIRFIEKVCESMATVVHALKVSEQTKALLESAQTQTEKLKAQEEELRQNMEELQATQEAMERKSMEADEKNSMLNAILDSALDGIITISEQGIIETLNPACARMLGYQSTELIGKNISVIMPEPHHSNHDEYLRHYLLTDRAKIIGSNRQMDALRKDGSRLKVELAVNVAHVGKRKIFTGILRDISLHSATDKNAHLSSTRQTSLSGIEVPPHLMEQ